MNKRASEPMEEPRLTELFGALWPKLEQELGKIPKVRAQGAAQSARPEAEVLEELVASVRTMDRRFDGLENIVNRIFEVAGTALSPRSTRSDELMEEARLRRDARLQRDWADREVGSEDYVRSVLRDAREDVRIGSVLVVLKVRDETPLTPEGAILTIPASVRNPRRFRNELKDETGIDVVEDQEWILYDALRDHILRVVELSDLPGYSKGESTLLLELVKRPNEATVQRETQ
jgi:hypothetical protein